MRLVITGGLGHIGSGLLAQINTFTEITEVLVIDNLSSNKLYVLFNKKNKMPIQFIEGDIIRLNLDKILKKNDILIHLAAITNAAESFKNKDEIFYNNFLSTKKIADIAHKKKLKCIFLSSTSVYGSSQSFMLEDDKKNIDPQSPYADCKIKEEKYIISKSKKEKIKTIILRLGTIFGPSEGMRFHTAVNKFCYQAAFNKSLTIWKTAYTQKRPYLDLNDAIQCIKFIISNNLFDNDVYNIATNNISVKNLLNNIRKYKKIKIKFVTNKIMNQLSYEASCKKISEKGFKFKGNLDRQIKNTLKLFSGIKNEL
jgi:nucleoside-diphosphate-sugar epimerase